jgi:hypothetical protein
MATPDDAVRHDDDGPESWPNAALNSGQETSGEPPEVQRVSDSVLVDRAHDLRIRPFSLRDLPAIWRLPGYVRLDIPDSLVLPGSGKPEVVAALPLLRGPRPTLVATADNQVIGFIRFSPRRPDGRWVATAIAAATGVYDPEPVWGALLAHGVRAAGLRGVRRLFARVQVDHPLLAGMRRTGWAPYARETVFRAERPTALSRPGRDLRWQEPADTWAIHQLYAASVPRQVQEIEAFTSHVWDMERSRRARRAARQSGWLLEEGGRLAGYARFTRSARAGMVDAVVAPGQSAQFGALLDAALSTPDGGRTRPIYTALRGYHLDLQEELRMRGFAEVGEQELLIRYTTATARAPAIDPVLFPVELRPALPRRAPTFLEGQPSDGTL